jgi:O-phosphoseryl-tRNA synthetase
MKFDPEDVRREKSENFEKTWINCGQYIRKAALENSYPRMQPTFGKSHPVYETIQRLREAYMRMGFSEYMNPLIVEERDIYKQFGDEAPAVLDRCFYLAGLPRPNVGISDERIRKIKEIVVGIDDADIEIIRKVLKA